MRRSAKSGWRQAARARTHGSSEGGTASGRNSPGTNAAGGAPGPFSTRPSPVRFGIAKRCAAPFGRKWKPDSNSIVIGARDSAGNGRDSMIDLAYGQIGTATPAVAASGAVQHPVASRTRSHEMTPSDVRTPVTRSPTRTISCAATPSRMLTPPSCADAANPASASSGSP
jgi:hypothetical protein